MKDRDINGTPQPIPPGAPRKIRHYMPPRDVAVPRRLFE